MGYTPHVVVIGGGVVGTGIARDLAIRGLEVTLLERDRLAAGWTGHTAGLLYSGAGHAVSQPGRARRLRAESATIRDMAAHCIDDTDALLLDLPGDDGFEARIEACRDLGIVQDVLSGDEVRSREPAVSPDVRRGIEVPDAVVDPFGLTATTARGAQEYDADVRTHHEVIDVLTDGGAIIGVEVRHSPPHAGDEESSKLTSPKPGVDDGSGSGNPETDGGKRGPGFDSLTGQGPGDVKRTQGTVSPSTEEIRADYVVNAAGQSVGEITAMAGIDLPLSVTRSTVAVTDASAVSTVLRHCDSEDCDCDDVAVPVGDRCVVGTTTRSVSKRDENAADEEVSELFEAAASIAPDLGEARTYRTDRGIRVAVSTSDRDGTGAEPAGRFDLLDHGRRDDRWGMTTVVGGTITTHRHVAEQVTDQVCREFGIDRESRTAEIPLPGPDTVSRLDGPTTEPGSRSPVDDLRSVESGRRSVECDSSDPVVCPCVGVTRSEIRAAIDDAGADLLEVQTRTCATMGECQGGRCAHPVATQLHPEYDPEVVELALSKLLAERWQGGRAGLWGEQLRRAARTYEFHAGTLSRGTSADETPDLDAYDDGRRRGSEESFPATREGFDI